MTNEEPTAARSADSALEADRRGAERYPCNLQPFWRIVSEPPAAAPPARVRDVSATGIGLLLPQPLKPGAVLVLTLQTRDQQLSRPLPVRVMHATRQADGGWL